MRNVWFDKPQLGSVLQKKKENVTFTQSKLNFAISRIVDSPNHL